MLKILLADYLEWELREGERIISQNESFVLLTPFWAVWPFEVMILPRRTVASIADLTDSERSAWADMIRDAAVRYDNLFSWSKFIHLKSFQHLFPLLHGD